MDATHLNMAGINKKQLLCRGWGENGGGGDGGLPPPQHEHHSPVLSREKGERRNKKESVSSFQRSTNPVICSLSSFYLWFMNSPAPLCPCRFCRPSFPFPFLLQFPLLSFFAPRSISRSYTISGWRSIRGKLWEECECQWVSVCECQWVSECVSVCVLLFSQNHNEEPERGCWWSQTLTPRQRHLPFSSIKKEKGNNWQKRRNKNKWCCCQAVNQTLWPWIWKKKKSVRFVQNNTLNFALAVD